MRRHVPIAVFGYGVSRLTRLVGNLKNYKKTDKFSLTPLYNLCPKFLSTVAHIFILKYNIFHEQKKYFSLHSRRTLQQTSSHDSQT